MHITREAYKIPSVVMSGWQMLLLDIATHAVIGLTNLANSFYSL